jgi:xanthine/uracil/vitamin C permease (AzgA family)
MPAHRYFDFAGNGTGYRQETVAGIATFLTIVLISFTYNIGVGMTAGLLF